MRHLAVIMDGNGRYAEKNGLTRKEGHEFGAKAFIKAFCDFLTLPIDVLSVYAFSTENNKRTKIEVSNIFEIIAYFLQNEVYKIAKENNCNVRFIGDIATLPIFLKNIIKQAPTFEKAKKTLVIALNYGGWNEVCRAINEIIKENTDCTEEVLKKHLDIPDLPFPDAVVRYGGYQRLSNFLPLQTAYSELFFLEKNWPEYEKKDIIDILGKYEKIVRNFGGRNA